MKISYAITVCNELLEIERLLPFLIKNKREQDEIIIFYDTKNGSKSVEEYLRSYSINKVPFRWMGYHFDGHFANMKNALTDACLGDYIFQIDADEIPHENLIHSIPELLEANPEVDMLRVPRVNTVEGLTEEHIKKWGWNVNEKGWVNWADWQMRIYKNTPNIKWINKVHEILDGFKTHGMLPIEEEWALYHPKNIERQEKQNQLYESL
jgi:hypothetical protein